MKPSIQKIITKLAKEQEKKVEKVELSLFSDFERSFDKANDSGLKISTRLIDALRKAEVEYDKNVAEWQKAIKFGDELEAAYKELGADMPSSIKNQILSCKSELKEEQKYISAIKGMYAKF